MLPRGKPLLINPYRGAQRPLWPFSLNRDSMQAAGLQMWLPTVDAGVTWFDRAGGFFDLAATNGPTLDPRIETGQNAWLFTAASSRYFSRSTSPAWTTSDSFSVSAWFRVASFAPTTDRVILEVSNSGTNEPLYFAVAANVNSNRLCFNAYNGSVIGAFALGASLSTNTWYHGAGTYDDAGSGTWTTYVNGLQNSTTTGQAIANVSYSMGVGSIATGAGGPGRYFDGNIDDVRMYTRCLSAAEVWKLYDPKTRWELYYPGRQRVYSFPAVTSGGPFPHHIRRQMSGGMISMSGGL